MYCNLFGVMQSLGKTLIAVHLIQARLNDLRKSVATGGKRQMIFFIAPTKILSGQQKRYISNHWSSKLYASSLNNFMNYFNFQTLQ
jgi:hypothetical protein